MPSRADLRAVLRARPGDMSGKALREATDTMAAITTVASHIIGALIVVVLLIFVLPVPSAVEHDTGLLWRNAALAAGYVALMVPIGIVRGLRITHEAREWLIEERAPTAAERQATLQIPFALLHMEAAMWAAAVVVFPLANLDKPALLIFEIAITVALGGVTTSTLAFLFAVRIGRATVARLLDDAPSDLRTPGVVVRTIAVWALGTGVPVLGALLVAAFTFGTDVTANRIALATLVLCAVALSVGLGATIVYARTLSDPLTDLRQALQRVERGDLDIHLDIYDSTELGVLQAGFNRMVAGLQERAKLQDLFGRHVGHDVARRALEEGVSLGGEEREAAALFIDVVGSTSFAAAHGPTETVEALNAFFAVVVEVCQAHGGLVNKFEGDAALCIFGAPLRVEDPAGDALAAAREMAARLTGDLKAGIGVSFGTVVAGNVGAADRFEYTVIGDPVNEAARLTELAKEAPGGVLAGGAAVERS